MQPVPVARPLRRRVRLSALFEMWMLVRLQAGELRRLRALEKVREFAPAKQCRPIPTAPQGGLPSVLLALPYSSAHVTRVGRTEYTHSNLNRRLIDLAEL